MVKKLILIALAGLVCGCSARGEQLRLKPLARGFSEAWEPKPRDFTLEINEIFVNGQETIHCVLRNVSTKTVEVDHQSLPWYGEEGFSVVVVAADGTVLGEPKDPPPFMSHIGPPRGQDVITAGGSIEGNILNLELIPVTHLPRSEDTLLLWSYRGLKNVTSGSTYVLSGITFLKAKP
jgi:hypothetical protein